MFSQQAHQTRQHLAAFAFALLSTLGMLGAVDSLASHPADELLMAQAPMSLQCPAGQA
jgi:hypothetical protein